MVAITNLLCLVAVASASILPRDYTQTFNDIKQIDADTIKLYNAINSWDGTTFGGASVQTAEQTVESDLKTANTNAGKISGTVTSAQASSIINYISGTLEPDVNKTLNALVKRKGQIQTAGLYSQAQSDLKNLKSLTDTFGETLISHTPAGQSAAARAQLNQLDKDFNAAIASYA